ncbi:hypothetical protein WJX81_001424 [Elliptochloris bilobata]|uniref:Cleavage/polyadenylation specificity factor A subunit C-terminal domain-containing protein n=1 Tax=Elliptochloris bilobata TaxID=381761 RepID=A0AAW1S1Z8_9CHLO
MTPLAVYREVHPPTGVSLCAAAYFTHVEERGASKTPPNVLLVRATRLEVLSVRAAEGDDTPRLEEAASYALDGRVESLAVLKSRVPGLQRDALLLTFRDAKLVVLDWDAATDSIMPSSLHCFEGDPMLTCGRTACAQPPLALADPQGRCAAVAMLQNVLAVLPAVETDVLESQLAAGGALAPAGGLPATVASSYLIQLGKLGIREVRDAAFLHRYNEPVLLVLHEPKPTWAGAARDRRDTAALVALSLNVQQRRHTRLWAAEGLPADALRLEASPAGGALVLCQSLILYHTQGASCALVVGSSVYAGVPLEPLIFNAMLEPPSVPTTKHARQFATNVPPDAAPAAATGAPRAEGFDLDLIGSAGAWLTDSTLLLALQSGELAFVHLHADGGLVKRLRVSRAGFASPSAGMCRLDEELLFMGSWAGESLLVRSVPEGAVLALPAPRKDASPDEAASELEAAERPEKRQRLEPVPSGLGDADEDDEVSLIYRTAEGRRGLAAVGASRFELRALDSLPGIGPRGPPELVVAVGAGRAGALALLRRALVPEVVTEVPLPGVQGLWAVRYQPQGLPWEPSMDWHAFLLMAAPGGTKALRTDEELDELPPTAAGLRLDRRTLLAGNLLSASRIIQVHPAGVTRLKPMDVGLLDDPAPSTGTSGVYCLVARASGLLQVYAAPSLQLLAEFHAFQDGPQLLQPIEPDNLATPCEAAASGPAVTELRMESFERAPAGNPLAVCRQPVLVALLADGSLLAYRAFDAGAGGIGIFVCGERPLWLLAMRGTLMVHPMDVEGAVLGFTPFHNINCPRGFISATASGALRICQLPARVRLDTHWPLQKVPLRATPHRVAFYAEARLYALLTSRQVPYKPRLEEEVGGDPHATYAYIAADAAAKEKGTELGAEVRLLAPGRWATVWRHALPPGEEPLTLAVLRLRDAVSGATQPLVAVGTCLPLGEDYPAVGRVTFFSVMRAEKSEGEEEPGASDWTADMIYTREFPAGPVTAMATLDGHLVIAAGNRVETHAWRGGRLQRTAFYDAQVLVSSLAVVKSYILAGDVHQGLTFLRCSEKATKLEELSRDFGQTDVRAADFLINGRKLYLAAADAGQTLRLWSYEQHAQSWGGKRLLPLGALHTGDEVGALLMRRMPPPPPLATRLQAALAGTLAGALGVLAPLWEGADGAALLRLQALLALALPHAAGLNPAAFGQRYQKLPQSLGGGLQLGQPLAYGCVLDGNLLARFLDAPRSRQAELAEQLGAPAARQ